MKGQVEHLINQLKKFRSNPEKERYKETESGAGEGEREGWNKRKRIKDKEIKS